MHSNKIKYFNLFLTALLILQITGCTSFNSSYIKADKKIYNINTNGKSKIRISEPNGEIRITGSDSISGIEIIAQFVVPEGSEGNSENITIKIDTAGSIVLVKSVYDRGFLNIGNPGYVNYDIIIPKTLSVEINSVNGDIFLTSVESVSSIGTVNSTVNILDCSGKIRVDGVNSDIVSNFNSTNGLNLSVVNGDIKLGGMKNIAAEIKISTLNGDVSFKGLTFSSIKFSGKRSFKGSIGSGGKDINISTVNGDIIIDADHIAYPEFR